MVLPSVCGPLNIQYVSLVDFEKPEMVTSPYKSKIIEGDVKQ
jgi:hypothetical protein